MYCGQGQRSRQAELNGLFAKRPQRRSAEAGNHLQPLGLAMVTAARMTAAWVTTTRVTTTRVTSAWMTSAWMTAARPSAAGSSATGVAHPGMSTWTSAATDVAVSVSAVPAMPTDAATPSKTAAPGVTAPIEAGTAPAVVVPAVISSAEDELSLFHVAGDGRRHQAVDWQSVGLATKRGERKQGGGGIDPWSHETSPPFF